ncbi:MAG: ribonuclease P protein component [Bacteroidia bacterium]|nr:ribonuclease P protein component [Bacteroidia bacterium]
MRQTFPKKERLYSRKLLESLVQNGNILNQYPLHIKWMEADLKEKVKARVAFAVPKRSFKKAVDRNRLKRRMREAWRRNKQGLSLSGIALLLVYTARKEETYEVIERSMKGWMLKIAKKS